MLIYFLFILYSVCRRHLEHLDADSETDAEITTSIILSTQSE